MSVETQDNFVMKCEEGVVFEILPHVKGLKESKGNQKKDERKNSREKIL